MCGVRVRALRLGWLALQDGFGHHPEPLLRDGDEGCALRARVRVCVHACGGGWVSACDWQRVNDGVKGGCDIFLIWKKAYTLTNTHLGTHIHTRPLTTTHSGPHIHTPAHSQIRTQGHTHTHTLAW